MHFTANAVRSNESRTKPIQITEGRYTVRLAETFQEIDEALKLRYQIFNVELGEGLDCNVITGRDEDEFDARCEHLIAIDNATGEVIGTYRTQTLNSAGSIERFYCFTEYDLANLPLEVIESCMEIGRACIAKEHRNKKVLLLLWKGLWQMAIVRQKRYLFGCCSLTSTDQRDGIAASIELEKLDAFHPKYWVRPHVSHRCSIDKPLVDHAISLPKLFNAYLRFGAKVFSPPAIDREFGTIDFMVLFDVTEPSDTARKMFEFAK